MFKLVLVFLMLLVTPTVYAGEPASMTAVSNDGNIVVLIYLEPCQDPTKSLIRPEYQDSFKEASFTVNGKHRQGCWTIDAKDGTVFVVDEDSEGSYIPKEAFQPTEDI